MGLPALRYKDLPSEQRQEIVEAVLGEVESGAKIPDLAKARKVSPTTLYRLILAERPDDWRIVQAARVLGQLEDAKQQMKDAKDHLALAKGDKLAARASWELERLFSKMYGPKQEPESSERFSITLNIGGSTQGPVVATIPAGHARENSTPEHKAIDSKPDGSKPYDL